MGICPINETNVILSPKYIQRPEVKSQVMVGTVPNRRAHAPSEAAITPQSQPTVHEGITSQHYHILGFFQRSQISAFAHEKSLVL